jgi:TM2 domain-containing membrane protein YozV
MPLISHYLPELDAFEKHYIEDLLDGLSNEQTQLFAAAYRQRRKDPHTILVATIIGSFGIPGLQRFWLGQVGMGFLYLFTWGFLLVGTIADLIRYKRLAFDYNQVIARRIIANINGFDNNSLSAARQHYYNAPSF